MTVPSSNSSMQALAHRSTNCFPKNVPRWSRQITARNRTHGLRTCNNPHHVWCHPLVTVLWSWLTDSYKKHYCTLHDRPKEIFSAGFSSSCSSSDSGKSCSVCLTLRSPAFYYNSKWHREWQLFTCWEISTHGVSSFFPHSSLGNVLLMSANCGSPIYRSKAEVATL